MVSIISCGLLLLVYGETKFHLIGFILVMTAAMLAGLRWTITQVLLQGSPEGSGRHSHGEPSWRAGMRAGGRRRRCAYWAARHIACCAAGSRAVASCVITGRYILQPSVFGSGVTSVPVGAAANQANSLRWVMTTVNVWLIRSRPMTVMPSLAQAAPFQ